MYFKDFAKIKTTRLTYLTFVRHTRVIINIIRRRTRKLKLERDPFFFLFVRFCVDRLCCTRRTIDTARGDLRKIDINPHALFRERTNERTNMGRYRRIVEKTTVANKIFRLFLKVGEKALSGRQIFGNTSTRQTPSVSNYPGRSHYVYCPVTRLGPIYVHGKTLPPTICLRNYHETTTSLSLSHSFRLYTRIYICIFIAYTLMYLYSEIERD